MDQVEVNNIVVSLSRAVEDLTHKVYSMEDAIANLNAYLMEKKEAVISE
tara:strand:+ start:6834 stop:6980 length:147 start_codon:yes stop_codon:yes gene_type:complete